MPVKSLDIFSYYDVQRFKQFSPMDCANWTVMAAPTGKKGKALYPVMGRKHVERSDVPVLEFGLQPRKIFKSISFVYVVVGATIYRVDNQFNQQVISDATFTQTSGLLNFAFLPTVQGIDVDPGANMQRVFVGFVDGNNMWIYNETTDVFELVTDPLAPPRPAFIAAFGNRFVVSTLNSTQFQLTQVNLGAAFDPALVFSFGPMGGPYATVFAQESGLIRQMAVLHNNLYIFTDYTTGIWSNTISAITTAAATTTFPWKKNTSYDFDFGIADPNSLDTDFGMMVWLGQNRNGLVTFLSSTGQSVKAISSQAINVLLQRIANNSGSVGLLNLDTEGFLYQYEDSVFYRASIGAYVDYQTLDRVTDAQTIEFNFDTESWHRCIELNGERNRVEQHEFFANKHLVSVQGQTCLYDMSGQYYFNELQDTSSPTGFQAYPFRYENITGIIAEEDYAEFKTNWVQIDFVWGDQTFSFSDSAYANTVFIVTEESTADVPVYVMAEDGVTFIIKDGTNTPELDSQTYNALFKPHVELYWSDDGGISFRSADVREFSQLGIYSWRMRWYQLGCSRNRVYKLICVSPAPVVVLGAVHSVDRVSGGAN